MTSIKRLKKLKDKKVLVRVDFNVPVKNGKVIDDFRIKKALPTLKYLKKKKAKIILIAHLGREGNTLKPVFKVLKKYFTKIDFIDEVYGEKVVEEVSLMEGGEILLLENLRKEEAEERGCKRFAKKLASLADIYVNEAFPVSHRDHTSITFLPELLPSYAGLQLEEEVKHLSFKKTKHPFLFILGGAKFETKMPLIKKYLKIADYIFIGGALANDFIKAKGFEVGESLVDKGSYDFEELLKNTKVITPNDVLVKNGRTLKNKKLSEIEKSDFILDIGEESTKKLEELVKSSKMILWNGPLGLYEDGGDKASERILKKVAKSKAISIIGGGDTASLVSELKLEKKLTFVSTGGGATLEFLSKGTLPGIKALN
jgi:3-phosphoglycerate kinase